MAQSLSDIVLHIVFSTKNRISWILPEIESELFQYVCGVARRLNSPVIKINGVEDHVHVLLQLGRTITVCDLISDLKTSSSKWMKTKDRKYADFSWQNGYGVFSVSRPNIVGVVEYINNQKDHHKTLTFKDELLSMLKRAEMDFDEKYLWD